MSKSYSKTLENIVKILGNDELLDIPYNKILIEEANSLLTALSNELTINEQLSEISVQSDTNIEYNHLEKQIRLHIERLKMYNDLKDSGMNIISLIASNSNTDISSVVKNLGIDVNE